MKELIQKYKDTETVAGHVRRELPSRRLGNPLWTQYFPNGQ